MNTFIRLTGMTLLGGFIGAFFGAFIIVLFHSFFGVPPPNDAGGPTFMLISIGLFSAIGFFSGIFEY